MTIVSYIWFRHEVVWWEYLLNFGIALICIFASKAIIEHTQVTDTEYWGGWATEVRYYEDWNEYIHQTCSRECCCTTDSNGNTSCSTEYYDCSYVDYHPEYWQLLGSNGESINISQEKYEELVSQFGTGKHFIDLGRNYHTNDGDMYVTKWGGELDKLESIVTKHSYENRVRVSSSTFALKEPPKEIFEEYGLYHYPKIEDRYKQKVILGYDNVNAEKLMQIINARLGAKYQFKTFIMVFKNQPREAGLYQEEQWQGGNKNELNIAIGIDDNENVKWCHVFSWTDERSIVVNIKNHIEGQEQLDLIEFAGLLPRMVRDDWVRKEFEDFSYLSVEPETHHIVWAFIVTLLVNIGVTAFVVMNNVTEDGGSSYSRNRYRRY